MPQILEHPFTPQEFIHVALPFLLQKETVNCLMAGLLWEARDDPSRLHGSYLAAATRDGEVVAVAMRTLLKLLLSHSSDATAMAVLAEDALRQLPDLGSVKGPDAAVHAFLDVWTRLTGKGVRLSMRQRIYRLETVRPVTGVLGAMRSAQPADRDLLIDWVEQFRADVGEPGNRDETAVAVARHLVRGSLFVWEDGEAASIAAIAGETPSGARIGPVYTPPRYRRHGYASALTAALSRQMLDRGKRWCCLYTNLANPTSNHIYGEIGFRPVCDVSDYEFPP